MAAAIPPGAQPKDGRVEVSATPSLNGADLSAVTFRLFGPGDITGIDTHQVIRTDPIPGANDFEPHCFPAIEFARADFPWLFSPLSPEATRLRPWLCLVVVEDRDGVKVVSSPSLPLPILTIEAKAHEELPNLAESWAWAHTQLNSSVAPAPEGDPFAATSEHACSRLLCLRKLKPNTSYWACLVPSFKSGVEAGCGDPVQTGPLTDAWQGNPDSIRLPLYYHWHFSTGAEGSFESLVTRLKAQPLSPGVGERSLDISTAGGGMPDFLNLPLLGLGSALRAPGARTSISMREDWVQALVKLLNAPADHTTSTPITALLGPPLYGRWHALRSKVPTPDDNPKWFRSLNIDPCFRVPAGLGTVVVQREQEQLMEAAWKQVGDLVRANRLLRQGQLGREVTHRLRETHFAPLPPAVFLTVTRPVFSRIVRDGETIYAQIAGSCLLLEVMSGACRRVYRRNGPVSRRFERSRAERRLTSGAIVPRLASGALDRPAPVVPDGMSIIDKTTLDRLLQVSTANVPPPFGDIARAFAGQQGQWQTLYRRSETQPCRRLAVEPLKQAIFDTLNPNNTIRQRIRAQIEIPSHMEDQDAADSLSPILAAPEFPWPMFKALRDLSKEWILAGLKNVPSNSITLVEQNREFIEAYMVGLNHEMARELLWRGFPTDQRGSCFRHFWDTRVRIPKGDDPEQTTDIPPIHQWDANELGSHVQSSKGAKDIVVLIRGDLVQRYPRAVIYAIPGIWSELNGVRAKPRVPNYTAVPTFPLFSASIDPDILLLGFPLSESEVRGDTDPAGNKPGYFIVFQEQPTEPRFSAEKITDDTAPPAAYLKVESSIPNAHAAAVAGLVLKHPFRLAVHMDDMLPELPNA
jgi:hypothetical protein